MGHAAGSFDVTLVPQAPAGSEEPSIARMTIDKTFKGDLEGTSKGQMLATMPGELGSGGYVAIELVTATLNGRKGTFVFQHSGTMTRGVPSMSVTVIPDSGTGDLEGLTGTITIEIEHGHHSYTFEYALPEKH